MWDRRTLNDGRPKPVGVLAGHMDGVTYIDSRGDGRHLISNSKDQSIKLWDIRRFSSEAAINNTLRAVHEQTWDYRWQEVPKKCNLFAVNPVSIVLILWACSVQLKNETGR